MSEKVFEEAFHKILDASEKLTGPYRPPSKDGPSALRLAIEKDKNRLLKRIDEAIEILESIKRLWEED